MNLLEDKDFLEFQGLQESAQLVKFSEIADQIAERLERGPSQYGDKMPWPKTFETFRFRPKEVTLWAGINGHGKSLILGQVICWLPYDVTSLIASLEMPVAATGARMCRQTLPSGQPSRQYIDEFGRLTDNIWVYDEQQSVETSRILALTMYAGAELGINHMVIDSLVKCGIKTDDYDKQKEFTDTLCQVAKATNMHIHLVHHIRKTDREGKMPDKFDVKGAGELTDLVDNVLIPWRNKDKERQTENGETVNPMEPDAAILCSKQRHGEWEGKINLWFDPTTTQMMAGPDSRLRWRIE